MCLVSCLSSMCYNGVKDLNSLITYNDNYCPSQRLHSTKVTSMISWAWFDEKADTTDNYCQSALVKIINFDNYMITVLVFKAIGAWYWVYLYLLSASTALHHYAGVKACTRCCYWTFNKDHSSDSTSKLALINQQEMLGIIQYTVFI